MSDIESAHSSYKLFCRIDEYISVRILQTQLLMRRYFFTSMVIIQLAKLIVRAAGPLMESKSFSNQVCDNVTYTVPLAFAKSCMPSSVPYSIMLPSKNACQQIQSIFTKCVWWRDWSKIGPNWGKH